MTSIDTDNLIRDEAKQLVRALLGDVAWVCKEHPRPDLHAVELLDAVIEELRSHRASRACGEAQASEGQLGHRMNAPLAADQATTGAEREMRKKAAYALMYGTGRIDRKVLDFQGRGSGK